MVVDTIAVVMILQGLKPVIMSRNDLKKLKKNRNEIMSDNDLRVEMTQETETTYLRKSLDRLDKEQERRGVLNIHETSRL